MFKSSMLLLSAAFSASAMDSSVVLYPKAVGGAAQGKVAAEVTNLVENTNGWGSLAGAKIYQIPQSQHLMTSFIPDAHKIEAGSYLKLTCADDPSIEMCDVYVNLYKCKDCTDLQTQNKVFGDDLLDAGFTSSSCAPWFTTGKAGGQGHKFTAFRKQIPRATSEVVTLNSDVDLAFFGLRIDGVDCSAVSLSKCDSKPHCKVDGAQCIDDWCPRVFQGPCPPPCACVNCALNEL